MRGITQEAKQSNPGNINYNVVGINKLCDGYFLLKSECKLCTIINLIKNFSASFASYSANYALCYASVGIIYITKDYSYECKPKEVV